MIGGIGIIASQITVVPKTANPTVTGSAHTTEFKGITTYWLDWYIKNNDDTTVTMYTKIGSDAWVTTTVAAGATINKYKSSSYAQINTLYAYAQANGKLASDIASLLLNN